MLTKISKKKYNINITTQKNKIKDVEFKIKNSFSFLSIITFQKEVVCIELATSFCFVQKISKRNIYNAMFTHLRTRTRLRAGQKKQQKLEVDFPPGDFARFLLQKFYRNISKMLQVRLTFKKIKNRSNINILDNIKQLKIESKANKSTRLEPLQ